MRAGPSHGNPPRTRSSIRWVLKNSTRTLKCGTLLGKKGPEKGGEKMPRGSPKWPRNLRKSSPMGLPEEVQKKIPKMWQNTHPPDLQSMVFAQEGLKKSRNPTPPKKSPKNIPKGHQNRPKIDANDVRNGIPKKTSKKRRKLCPKASKMEPKIDPKTIKSRSWGPLPRWCWPFGRQRAPQGGTPPKGSRKSTKICQKTALKGAVGERKKTPEKTIGKAI